MISGSDKWGTKSTLFAITKIGISFNPSPSKTKCNSFLAKLINSASEESTIKIIASEPEQYFPHSDLKLIYPPKSQTLSCNPPFLTVLKFNPIVGTVVLGAPDAIIFMVDSS